MCVWNAGTAGPAGPAGPEMLVEELEPVESTDRLVQVQDRHKSQTVWVSNWQANQVQAGGRREGSQESSQGQ